MLTDTSSYSFKEIKSFTLSVKILQTTYLTCQNRRPLPNEYTTQNCTFVSFAHISSVNGLSVKQLTLTKLNQAKMSMGRKFT